MCNGWVIFLGAYYANMRIWLWLKAVCFERALANRFVKYGFILLEKSCSE